MTTPARRLHAPALVAFFLGLASLVLLGVTGVPAFVIGVRSLRRINGSDGALLGARLAVAGMVLGGLATCVTVVGLGAILVVKVQLSSRRLAGIDHLRQIGLGLNAYYASHGAYPAATRDPAGLPPDRRLSWMADLLPLLAPEKPIHNRLEKLAAQIDRDRGWDDPANAAALGTPIRLFLAPGHPDFNPRPVPGVTHFVGVAGIGPGAAYLPRGDPRAGMFGHDRGVKRSEIGRGASNTLMLLETAHDNGPWLAGGFPTVRDVDPQGGRLGGPGEPFGGITRGLVEALWVDGSVRALRDDTPGKVFRAHATLREP